MQDAPKKIESNGFGFAKIVFRLVVIGLVLWGLARAVNRALVDLKREQQQLAQQLADVEQRLAEQRSADVDDGQREEAISSLMAERELLLDQQFTMKQVRFGWLLLAALFYVIGVIPSWLYWQQVLLALRQEPLWWVSLRAFCIGHLGKYVPGKALVVIIRAKLVSGPRVDTTVAATAVFVETLTTMAVGACLAAAILMFYLEHWFLIVLAVGLMLAAGVPTLPFIFRRLVRLVRAHKVNPEIHELLEGLNLKLLAKGWLLISFAWLFNGLSLWATMNGLPGTDVGLDYLPMLIATVGLAMVAGFLSLIPGGAGIRELVVTTLLAPLFGSVVAISSAILLRLVWLVSELVISGILYVGVKVPADGK